MKARISGGAGCAVVLAFAVAASAQEPPQPPSTASPTAKEVTVTGCVQSEADYRKARDAGGGGVAGTGVGVANEFVLINASLGSAGPATPTGTSGSAVSSAAYEMTGPNEGKLAEHVGKRVEIRGKLKAGETGPGGQPTGGATAGKPPTGVDVGGKDLKLGELEITAIRPVEGTCPAGK
jgi:hypothetical protein